MQYQLTCSASQSPFSKRNFRPELPTGFAPGLTHGCADHLIPAIAHPLGRSHPAATGSDHFSAARQSPRKAAAAVRISRALPGRPAGTAHRGGMSLRKVSTQRRVADFG